MEPEPEPEPEHHYLYFWDMEIRKGVVGHIVLNVWCPKKQDYIYISHWPEQRTLLKGQKGQKSQITLLDDIIAEGNRNPQVLEIPFKFLDPAEINEWLHIETKDPGKPYNFKNWNCANVVCKALQIGLRARNLQFELEQQFMGSIQIFPLTPENLFSWVQHKVQVDKRAQNSGPAQISVSLHPCDPRKPTENFSVRSTHFLKVCTSLQCSEKALVATVGTGGVGKTEFVRKVALELSSSSSFENRVFWMNAETRGGLQKSLFDLSTHLKISSLDQPMPKMSKLEMRKLFHDIYSHFSTNKLNSLFIFDNVGQFGSSSSSSSRADESIFSVSDFLPNSFPDTKWSPWPAILITSRSSGWFQSEDFEMINLENFTLEETVEYFRNTFKEISQGDVEECKREIELLHKQLDGYTLGLTVAADWLRGAGFKVNSRKLKEGLECYLQFFQRPSFIFNEKKLKVSSSSSTLTSLDTWTNYKYDPREIMEQTCAAIGRENPLALTLLKQMSLLSPEFLTVTDCVLLNNRYNMEPTHSALTTLSKFNIVSILDLDLDPASGISFDSSSSIKIHRVFQHLVKNSQIKSRDPSILFQVCERVLSGGNYPHLLSLDSCLKQFEPRKTWWSLVKEYFWLTIKWVQITIIVYQLIMWCLTWDSRWRPNQEYIRIDTDDPSVSYLTSCYHAICNSDETVHSVLMKIDKKLGSLMFRIESDSVMDNSDILNESDTLYRITYQEMTDFTFHLVLEKPEHLRHGIQMKILKVLGSFGIWPQKHIDKAVSWLKSQRGGYWFKNSVLVFCLKNPNLTNMQRQELQLLQLKFELFTLKMQLVDDANGENWLNILQYDRTLRDQPFVLADNDRIEFLQKGIKVSLATSDDIFKHKLFLNVIQANLKQLDGRGEQLIAKRLVKDLLADATLTSISSSESMQRFTDIFLLFLPFPRLFSQEDLDNRFSSANISFMWNQGSINKIMCSVFTTISIMSVIKRKDLSQKYSKKLCENLKLEHINQIAASCSPQGCKMWSGFLPHLRSFVKHNQKSEHKETKDLVKMIQLWTSKHRCGKSRVLPVLVGVGVCAIGVFGYLWFSRSHTANPETLEYLMEILEHFEKC